MYFFCRRPMDITLVLLFFSINVSAMSIPRIDVDNIDWNVFQEIVETCGSFELVGESMDRLAEYVPAALGLAKNIFDQPREDLLATVPQGPNKFYGFQDVKTNFANREFARDQIAFHFKPYLPRSLPQQVTDDQAFHDYWNQAMPILHKLYNAIAERYVPAENRTDLSNDSRSALSTRRYLKSEDGNVGIEPHSDTALLTLITADEDGLDILKNGEWIRASAKPHYRFYINIGDWQLFQMGNHFPFVAGMYRVPKIQPHEPRRHSLIIFLNPAWDEVLETPSGKKASYQEYLFSADKKIYTTKN